MSISATSPSLDPAQPAKKLRRLWRPRFVSTWIVIFLAACAATVTELPGWRAGATQYAHGWPLAYLHRDYSKGSVFNDIFHTIQQVDGTDDTETGWRKFGLPWAIEQQLDPWSMANIREWAVWPTAVDFVCVLLTAVAVGWMFDRLRRRRTRWFQFRLKTLLLAVPLIAVACAWIVDWRNQRQLEAQLLHEMFPANAQSQAAYMGWVPPAWLPDCLIKPSGFGTSFERATYCSPKDEWVNDASIGKLAPLTRVVSLLISSKHLGADGLAKLKNLPRLTCLWINLDSPLTEPEAVALAESRNIEDLTLASGASAAAVGKLRELPQLRSLHFHFRTTGDSDAVKGICQLQNLDRLTIWGDEPAPIRIEGLPRLRAVEVEWGNGFFPSPSPNSSVELRFLPLLDEAIVQCAGHLRVQGVPSLTHLSLDTVFLDHTALEQIRQCSRIEYLNTESLRLASDTPLSLHGMQSLVGIVVNGSELKTADLFDLPRLQSADVSDVDLLQEFQIRGVPQLKSLDLERCPRVRSLDLTEARNLKSLNVNLIPIAYVTPSSFMLPDRPRRIAITGLGRLTHLENLNLGGYVADPRRLSEILSLRNLQSLSLPSARLTDADVMRFTQLSRLATLELAGNEITDASLKIVQNLPQLDEIWLNQTMVTHSAVKKLSQRFPKIDIRYDWEEDAIGRLKHSVKLAFQGRRSAIDLGLDHGPPAYLGDRDVSCLDGLDDLGWLSLSHTHLTGAGLAKLSGLDQLQGLDLSSTPISDAGLVAVAKFGELRQLDLAHTLISGDGLRNLQPLRNLIALDLSDTDITDAALDLLRFTPHLQRLSLADTRITDAGVRALTQLRELRVIDLAGTAVTSVGLAQLRGLKKLESLTLGDEPISDAAIDRLQDMPRLATLELPQDTPLSDKAIERIASLSRLQSMRFRPEAIDADGLRCLARSKSLRELWFMGLGIHNDQLSVLHLFKNVTKLRVLAGNSHDLYEMRLQLPKADVDAELDLPSPVILVPEPSQSISDDANNNPNGDYPPGIVSPDETPPVGLILSPSRNAIA